jgi:hypothetical protein
LEAIGGVVEGSVIGDYTVAGAVEPNAVGAGSCGIVDYSVAVGESNEYPMCVIG